MKTKTYLHIFAYFFLITVLSNAQVKPVKNKLTNPFETEGSIDARFDYLYRTSTNYLEYKVISRKGFSLIQNNVKDTIFSLKGLISKKDAQINKQTKKIASFEKLLEKNKLELTEVKNFQDSISFFGLQIDKQNYNLIIIIIITSLIVSTAFFVYKYQNSYIITKEAKDNYEDVQREFEIFQKKALERQQVLNRKLQDEIMKNKND